MTINVTAQLAIDLGRSGHRTIPMKKVQAFSVDSAMDTDADSFSIAIGAPDASLKSLLSRDTEVRVALFTSGVVPRTVEHLHNGIVDVYGWASDDFTLALAGRDFTSVAVDSDAPPGEKKLVRPNRMVAAEAHDLGISKMKLQAVRPYSRFYRDGSESYWASWYRLYRHRKMWMWAEPDGTLYADKLHYAYKPTYYFGVPTRSATNKKAWIPVERCQITKNTQGRVGEVWVFGERGDIGFLATAIDPTIRSWKKRPLKIQTSTTAKNKSEARAEAWEEIFEGKVGELEIELTVPLSHTGNIIRQNRMAQVNIPMMGLTGIFFVVGVQLVGGAAGYAQIVRLREKNFAISRRVPDDPELKKDPGDQTAPGSIGTGLTGAGIRWGNSFASAAQEFHDGWDLALFLGVLLSLCRKESNFRNVRSYDDTEWYAKPSGQGGGAHGDAVVERWYDNFANNPDNPRLDRDRSIGRAVGPMQLLSPQLYKQWADDFGGKHDEYEGGRWMPQSNIRAGARVLADKLRGLDPKNPSNIWIGVERYYGSNSDAANKAYMKDVKGYYDDTYGATAQGAVDQAKTIPSGETTNITVRDANGNPFTVHVPTNAPANIKKVINYVVRQLGKPYQWGAEGPSSFDCSGLVLAAYLHVGIRLTRTTYTQVAQRNLQKVTKDELLAGDIVFFSNAGDVHHEGMYLSDGHFIQAPHTGDVVKISPLSSPYYRDEYYTARRVIPWTGRGRSTGD